MCAQVDTKIVKKRKIDQVSVEDFKKLNVIDESDVKDVLSLFEDMNSDESLKHFGFKNEVMADSGLGKTRWGISGNGLVKGADGLNKYSAYLLDEEYITEGSPSFLFDFEVRGNRLANDDVVYDKKVKRIRLFKPDKRAFQFDPIEMLNILWKSLLALYYQYQTGTIIIDTSSKLGNLIRKYMQYLLMTRGAKFARMEEMVQLVPSDYGVRNDMMNYLFAFMNITPFHFVFTTELTPEWDVVKGEGDEEGKLKKTGRMIPKRYELLPFAVDLSMDIKYARNQSRETVRRFTKIKSSWESKVPLELTWDNPEYIDNINTMCKYSHQRILKKKFSKTQIEEDKLKEKKAMYEARKKALVKEKNDELVKQKNGKEIGQDK